MSISRFSSLKVPELKEYLSRRGISVTRILKNKLVNLCEAVETLNLPVDPDCLSCKDDSTVTLDKIRSVGCPFDNPFTAPGYTSDFSNIPDFSLYDLFNYLINSKADYDKKKLKAYKSCDDYRLFIDGHIEELLFNELKSYPVCLFKAKCKPTQREVTYLNKKHYDLWILIENEHSEVKAAYCTCTGGADGACRHVSAALYELENFEQKSVTDGENQWAKRPHLHDNPVPVKKLKVVKAKYSSLNQSDESVSTASYDPRIRSQRDITTQDQITSFAQSLKEISPNAQALDLLVLDDPDEKNGTCTKLDEKCMKLSIRQNVKQYLDQEVNTDSVTSTHLCKGFLEQEPGCLTLSSDQVEYIEQATIGQVQNKTWNAFRIGMITASSFRKVCDTIDNNRNPPSLLKSLLGKYASDYDIDPAPLEWGKKNEQKGRDLYMRANRRKHLGCKITQKGLTVYPCTCYIGCSSDGVFSCKCKNPSHENKNIEIKCPYSLRNENPKTAGVHKGCELIDGKWVVAEKSDYFHQIQAQMGILELSSTDLVIYTRKGIHVAHCEFDQIFFENMIHKVKTYFEQNLLSALISEIQADTL